MKDIEKLIEILGTNLQISDFIDLDNFNDLGYMHFIKLYEEKSKTVNFFLIINFFNSILIFYPFKKKNEIIFDVENKCED